MSLREFPIDVSTVDNFWLIVLSNFSNQDAINFFKSEFVTSTSDGLFFFRVFPSEASPSLLLCFPFPLGGML